MFVVFFKTWDTTYTFKFFCDSESQADSVAINYRKIGFYAWTEKV